MSASLRHVGSVVTLTVFVFGQACTVDDRVGYAEDRIETGRIGSFGAAQEQRIWPRVFGNADAQGICHFVLETLRQMPRDMRDGSPYAMEFIKCLNQLVPDGVSQPGPDHVLVIDQTACREVVPVVGAGYSSPECDSEAFRRGDSIWILWYGPLSEMEVEALEEKYTVAHPAARLVMEALEPELIELASRGGYSFTMDITRFVDERLDRVGLPSPDQVTQHTADPLPLSEQLRDLLDNADEVYAEKGGRVTYKLLREDDLIAEFAVWYLNWNRLDGIPCEAVVLDVVFVAGSAPGDILERLNQLQDVSGTVECGESRPHPRTSLAGEEIKIVWGIGGEEAVRRYQDLVFDEHGWRPDVKTLPGHAGGTDKETANERFLEWLDRLSLPRLVGDGSDHDGSDGPDDGPEEDEVRRLRQIFEEASRSRHGVYPHIPEALPWPQETTSSVNWFTMLMAWNIAFGYPVASKVKEFVDYASGGRTDEAFAALDSALEFVANSIRKVAPWLPPKEANLLAVAILVCAYPILVGVGIIVTTPVGTPLPGPI